jgi:hypothetical protein
LGQLDESVVVSQSGPRLIHSSCAFRSKSDGVMTHLLHTIDVYRFKSTAKHSELDLFLTWVRDVKVHTRELRTCEVGNADSNFIFLLFRRVWPWDPAEEGYFHA